MGLDVSHDCWSGSYGNFGRFRKVLAGSIDIDLDKMQGFSGSEISESWEDKPDNDLHILLHHSDCDGEISVEDAKKLLDKMVKHRDCFVLYDESNEFYLSRYDQWIEGLRCAVESNEIVEFF